ncbi:MerR family transcriptional regulator [Acetobacterium sp.]|uniref:MerR family transcriptional regulator n=1 Tax=Acetobacterium sp. TaxID=1872094 RepID=UPI000CB88CBD|nr:MerR family transcriptional regulator [Acetobacterium sp.]MDO9493953.1 MerR family transcriptional regulator [Acetobacterium sp.]PKM75244.1 MAG: MerR family transcriptional regulator [Firmicutes bacterium HGW-Firmicutes-17]
MTYTIGEFSRLINLSIHTLRYYEQQELITPQRLKNGRRCYSESDLTWIQFIRRLKDTGMPIKEIQKYAKMRAVGDATLVDRMELLIKHRQILSREIMNLQEHQVNLDNKIDYYKTAITERIEDN